MTSVGAVLSATVTWKLAEAALLRESAAEQVTVRLPSAKVDPDAGKQDTPATTPSTRSTATGVAKLTFDPAGPFASTVRLGETFCRVGPVVSTTSTTKDAASEVLFAASVAVHRTIVFPRGNVSPDGRLHATVGEGSIASVAVTENVTTAPLGPVASFVIEPGTETVGAPASTTLIVNVAGADVLLAASVAVQETVVIPSGKVAPEGGLQETVGEGSIVSVALTENVTLAPPGPVAFAVIGAGTVTVGAVKSTSTTVTVNVAVPTLPAPSGAEVQVTVVLPTEKFDPDAGKQDAPREPETRSVADADG
jgi:hypothetical protein